MGGKTYGESCFMSVVEDNSARTAEVAIMVDNGLNTLPNPVITAKGMEFSRREKKIGTNYCP